VSEHSIDRRQFLTGSAGLIGLGLLSACASKTGISTSTPTTRPSIGAESGNLSILEWGGYEAKGTKAQKYPVLFGKEYTQKFGPAGITYSYIVNDDQALQKAASGGPFDVMHPCHENLPDYVNQGLVQPWDTSLIPSFKELNPYLVKQGSSTASST
jgi:Spermidine/putrescine-binding periplasmic protein